MSRPQSPAANQSSVKVTGIRVAAATRTGTMGASASSSRVDPASANPPRLRPPTTPTTMGPGVGVFRVSSRDGHVLTDP